MDRNRLRLIFIANGKIDIQLEGKGSLGSERESGTKSSLVDRNPGSAGRGDTGCKRTVEKRRQRSSVREFIREDQYRRRRGNVGGEGIYERGRRLGESENSGRSPRRGEKLDHERAT